MARKTKASGQTGTPKSPADKEEIEDAVEISDAGDATEPSSDATAAVTEEAEAAAPEKEPATDTEESSTEPDGAGDPPAEATDEPARAEETEAPEAVADETPDDAPRADEARVEEAPTPVAPPPAPQQVTVQKVGFVPLVLGGAIAAALGFGVAWLYLAERESDLAGTIAAQAERIASLESQVAAIPTEAPDLSPLETRIAEAEQALGGRIETVSGDVAAQIAGFDERLTAVERAPGVDGTLAETAIASWQRELDTLREEIVAQQERMAEIATSAEAELEASRAAAAAVEENAARAAEQAVVRAALARIQTAIDAGTPFDAAVADLAETGTEVPEQIAAVAFDGVPTVGDLRKAFPEAARAALAAARAEGLADADSNPVTAFLRNQFDVRSVTPREGDDPDAILSRVNAALADNRLTDALAEIEALPEVARAEMSGWIAQAEARVAAAAAVETLDQSMNN